MKPLSVGWSVFLLVFASLTFGQTAASISGTATDSSGAVIDGAQVTVTNDGTSWTRTVKTNASGVYSVPNLVPGTYTVTVLYQ